MPACNLRRGNVGRRWLYLRRLYSGEAAGVGGNHLVGCSPPARELLSVSAISAVNVAYIYVPLALTAISLIFVYLYKLDREYDNIIKDLDERKLKQ